VQPLSKMQGGIEMNETEHIEKHKLLHKYLDELVADFIQNTENLLSNTTILDFMDWSYSQTIETGKKGLK